MSLHIVPEPPAAPMKIGPAIVSWKGNPGVAFTGTAILAHGAVTVAERTWPIADIRVLRWGAPTPRVDVDDGPGVAGPPITFERLLELAREEGYTRLEDAA